MSKISIVCICFHNGKVLVAHRNPVGKMGGRWEFPGGKVESNESDESAIVREMQEEFGVEVKVLEKICCSNFENKEVSLELHVYNVDFPYDGMEVPFKLTEHSEYKWINFKEIQKEDFVDSDYSVLKKCMDFFGVK